MVDWGSVKCVVFSNVAGVVSVGVGLERLIGICGEGLGVSRFLVFGVGRTRAGLAGVGVSECDGGGIVVHLSVCMDSDFLPHGSLLMVEAVCGVDENWTVQSW